MEKSASRPKLATNGLREYSTICITLNIPHTSHRWQTRVIEQDNAMFGKSGRLSAATRTEISAALGDMADDSTAEEAEPQLSFNPNLRRVVGALPANHENRNGDITIEELGDLAASM